MKSNQNRLCVILVAFIYFGCAEGSCRFYEEELAVNQTWASCKELCVQKDGSCLAWAHNMETKRCAGWMLESQSETGESAMSSSKDNNDAEGSVVAKDADGVDSEDGDARASSPSQRHSSYGDEDDEDSTTEDIHASFYNTRVESEKEGNDDDEDSTAEVYYSPFYNVSPERVREDSDLDDEGSSDYTEYDNFYYVDTPYDEDDDDDHDDGSTSDSTSSDIPSNKTATPLVPHESDPEIRAVIEEYISIYRGPLYNQCEVIVAPNFTIPVDSVYNTMNGCFFQKIELTNSSTKENCIAVCQNLHSSAHATCIAWMWREEEQDCIGLVVALDSNYSFCALF